MSHNTAKAPCDTDLDLGTEDSPMAYKVGTAIDQHDMRRVGKAQELRVGTRLYSTTAPSC